MKKPKVSKYIDRFEGVTDFTCEICGHFIEFKHHKVPLTAVSNHIKNHKITSKEYYRRYLKKPEEGICQNPDCRGPTKQCSIRWGYKPYCTIQCFNSMDASLKGHYSENLSHSLSVAHKEGRKIGYWTTNEPWNKGLTSKSNKKMRDLLKKGVETKRKNGTLTPWNKGMKGQYSVVCKNPEQRSRRISEALTGKKLSENHKKKLRDHRVQDNFGKGGKFSQLLFRELNDKLSQIRQDFEIHFGDFDRETKTLLRKERSVNVIGISKTHKMRYLDCYLKIDNRKINIEFDEKGHSKEWRMSEDLEREWELLQRVPELEIYRIRFKDFLEGQTKIVDDLIKIILDKDSNVDNKYLSLTKLKETSNV